MALQLKSGRMSAPRLPQAKQRSMSGTLHPPSHDQPDHKHRERQRYPILKRNPAEDRELIFEPVHRELLMFVSALLSRRKGAPQ
jgi:hypothetical protein